MSNSNMPAFPACIEQRPNLGLTKREYFAALALQGLLSGSPELHKILIDNAEKSGLSDFANIFAATSFALGDALLAALEMTTK